jgi:hypothetical protein
LEIWTFFHSLGKWGKYPITLNQVYRCIKFSFLFVQFQLEVRVYSVVPARLLFLFVIVCGRKDSVSFFPLWVIIWWISNRGMLKKGKTFHSFPFSFHESFCYSKLFVDTLDFNVGTKRPSPQFYYVFSFFFFILWLIFVVIAVIFQFVIVESFKRTI